MGKRKKARQRKKSVRVSPTQERRPANMSSQSNKESDRKRRQIMLLLSICLFVAENLWGTTMVAHLSLRWNCILFLLCNTVIIGWWVWLLVDRIYKKRFHAKMIKLAISFIPIALVLFITFPYYVDLLPKPQGTIQIPPYTPDSTQVIVSYGNRHVKSDYQTGDAITTIGELKQKPFVSLAINGRNIFSIHINEQREVSIDTMLFTGFYNESEHIFTRPVIVTDTAPDYLPNGWHIYQYPDSVEIDNQDGIPVLLMEYRKPYRIYISGLFVTPMGVCKVDNEPNELYILGDNMTQLGTTYIVDQVTIHSIPDLFRLEHVYDLSKWR
jgi:hypothetical protein